MASAWEEEETFVCSVCLETMKDPATVPCGHSYCLRCIQNHWDREDSKGRYSCPQCRRVFRPRPLLAKSTLLVEAMEKLRAGFERSTSHYPAPPSLPVYADVLPGTGDPGEVPGREGSIYPQLPSSQRPCPLHKQPLDLYCLEDKECICKECCRCEHAGHCVLTAEDERRAKQKELVKMQADVQIRIQETERDMMDTSLAALPHKTAVQALQKESTHLMLEMRRGLELMGTQVDQLLSAHQLSLCRRPEAHVQRLEQRAAQLHRRRQEMDGLADMADHVCFLKNFHSMAPLVAESERDESGLAQEHKVISGVRSTMSELRNSVQGLSKDSLAKIFRLVNDVTLEPLANGETEAVSDETDDSSEAPTVKAPPLLHPPQASLMATAETTDLNPKTRQEMKKYRCELTMDPDTVFRYMLLSAGGHKATLCKENQNPADHPQRFHFWRQVLCREPLSGSPFYWEVEWAGLKMTIGVAYKEMERKTSDERSRLGHNSSSWGLSWSGTGWSFWSGGQETPLGSRKAARVGLYLDQPSGLLEFYRVSRGHAKLIHRHRTRFTAPLYPGFRFGPVPRSSVLLCSLD
ncbi:hypothetical protein NHX12_009412 [Muraenolepis orangiensis]|uniref:Tripartite motif-containing protein 16-like n=1 Tax=Muraenolepis orangiensis TaxID=630683 RepID=A0A9Q0DRU4_9TELE|nr:hypothetical protein NHX12_009412 [Muraenolepis orangiensis]